MKVKMMVELFDNLNKKAFEIAAMTVATMIDDVDQLTVALCAGNLNEIAYALHETQLGESKREAARKALELGLNPVKRGIAASKGFFAKGLCGLLNLAKDNPDAGSRLMPIFNELVTDYKKYGIPKKLKATVKNYMSEKKNTDGFALMGYNLDDGGAIVCAADWVTDALFFEDD